jgi:ABC-type transport system involved in cytochrome c biogenesis permease subunit
MIMLQAGETSNMAFAQEEVELAIVQKIGDDKEKQIAVDEDMLVKLAGEGLAMTSDLLPFDIRVDKWMRNSKVGRVDDKVTDNPATQGMGTSLYAYEVPSVGGAMKGTNRASAYISLIDKTNKNVIGTWLVSQDVNDAAQLYFKTEPDVLDKVELNGQNYEIGLRFRRNYKPYDITLENVRQINYSGTETPRDYSSFVKIANRQTNVSQEGRIWMNNPMRFDGETFYQSEFISKESQGSMLPPGKEAFDTTGLQVVTNAGWMLPYLSCVFAGLGMLVHFGNTFVRFAGRFDRELNDITAARDTIAAAQTKKKTKATSQSLIANEIAEEKPKGASRWVVPLCVIVLIGFGTFGRVMPRAPKDGATNWYLAGQIPAQEDGRIMPLDSVARRFLQTLSGATYTVLRGDPDGADKQAKEDRKVTAVEFLFALANNNPIADKAKIFRIDAEELRNLLDLNVSESGGRPHWLLGEMRRPLKNRYSLEQLKPRIQRFFEESDRVVALILPTQSGGQGLEASQLEFSDRKLLDLRNQLNLYLTVREAFGATPIPFPRSNVTDVDMEKIGAEIQRLGQEMERLDDANVARIVPPVLTESEFATASDKQKTWRPLNPAVFDMQRQSIVDVGFNDTATKSIYNVFAKQAQGSTNEFHKAINDHLKYMATTPFGHGYGDRVAFEAWYNYFNPFMQAIIYYCIAVVLTLLSFLFCRQSFRRAAFWICALVFILHTAAIITRVYISQRPPVINLYSSAVYIGWASVLAGLIIEKLYPIRLGVLVGSAMGVLTLLVAWGLDTSDTMPVLQAVLDTQFWLTTHVQCITLGYAATFFAGFIGIYALIHRIVASRLANSDPNKERLFAEQKILYKLCYGIVCFGLFFSFIGTVLGGLWADDSWGRFWGWDPKENGALMIVLWNAILLHARWDKLVLERGFYLLAIGGNIMTAWSWFGTNQLGIGLHSYGFTESVLFILTAFVISQIALIIAGLVMLRPNSSPPQHA